MTVDERDEQLRQAGFHLRRAIEALQAAGEDELKARVFQFANEALIARQPQQVASAAGSA